jgi:hypothetical protein
MSVDVMWRVVLLTIVFLVDIVVFVCLCRDEIRDWRVRRCATRAESLGGSKLSRRLRVRGA